MNPCRTGRPLAWACETPTTSSDAESRKSSLDEISVMSPELRRDAGAKTSVPGFPLPIWFMCFQDSRVSGTIDKIG